jgi:hypothetical protein
MDLNTSIEYVDIEITQPVKKNYNSLKRIKHLFDNITKTKYGRLATMSVSFGSGMIVWVATHAASYELGYVALDLIMKPNKTI